MPVILTVLRVLGIVLLAVLCLVLLLLLLILLVPLRYRGTGQVKADKPEAAIRVTWFGPLLALDAGYREGIYLKLRVLWLRLLGDEKGEEKKEKKAGKKKSPPKEKTPADSPPADSPPADSPPTDSLSAESPPADGPSAESSSEENAADSSSGDSHPGEEAGKEGTGEKTPEEETEKKPLSDRISDAIDTVIDKKDSLEDKLEEKLPVLEEKIRMVTEILEDPENYQTAGLVLKQIKKLIIHYIPRKLSGYLKLGLSDPYQMGQVMSAAAFFYPIYEKDFTFTPVFDEEIREGEFTFTGHIRLVHAAWAVVRILLDRNARRWIKKILHRGG